MMLTGTKTTVCFWSITPRMILIFQHWKDIVPCLRLTTLNIFGILLIKEYDDCFVLANPGLLKLPIEQIYAGGESKARNQRMQNMICMIGYGENLGSDFPLILSAWNEKHWLKPELIEQRELTQVKLTFI